MGLKPIRKTDSDLVPITSQKVNQKSNKQYSTITTITIRLAYRTTANFTRSNLFFNM